MAVTKIKPIKSTLKKAIEYIQNPDKTDDKMLVSVNAAMKAAETESFGGKFLLNIFCILD